MSRPAPAPLFLWPLVGVGILAISCAAVLIRLAEAPALSVAAWRVTLAALCVGPYAIFSRTPQEGAPVREGLPLMALSGVFLALHFAFWISSLSLTTVASSVTIVATMPIFTGLFSALWLRERLPGSLWAGIGVSLCGIAVTAGADFSLSRDALFGDLLSLLGALAASGYFLAGRAAQRRVRLADYAAVVYGSGAVALLLMCALSGSPLSGFTGKTYLALVLLGLVPQLIGHTTFNWTLRHLPATVVAVLVLGEPIGATALAWVLLGEAVGGAKAIGLLVLAAGILLASLGAARAAPAAPGVDSIAPEGVV